MPQKTYLVCKDQRQLGFVFFVALQNLTDQLQHGCDACSAGYHVNILGGHMLGWILAQFLNRKGPVAQVLQTSRGSAEGNLIADLHLLQVLRHLAASWELGMRVLEVHLHHKIHIAYILVRRDRSVWPNDELVLDCRYQMNVLAHRQAQYVLFRRQAEAETTCIMAEHLLLNQWQLVLVVRINQGAQTRCSVRFSAGLG